MLKTIEFDWNNPSEIKKKISLLQKRRKDILRSYGYNEIKFSGTKYNFDNIMPIFEKIYNTDFTHMYDGCDNKNQYYVYAHCNPMKKLDLNNLKHFFIASKFSNMKYVPFYIGKGIGDRYKNTNRNDSHRKIKNHLSKFKKDIDCVILIDNLTEAEAYSYESKLIDLLGLKILNDDNLLCNLDEGLNNDIRRNSYNDDLIFKLLKKNGYKF